MCDTACQLTDHLHPLRALLRLVGLLQLCVGAGDLPFSTRQGDNGADCSEKRQEQHSDSHREYQLAGRIEVRLQCRQAPERVECDRGRLVDDDAPAEIARAGHQSVGRRRRRLGEAGDHLVRELETLAARESVLYGRRPGFAKVDVWVHDPRRGMPCRGLGHDQTLVREHRHLPADDRRGVHVGDLLDQARAENSLQNAERYAAGRIVDSDAYVDRPDRGRLVELDLADVHSIGPRRLPPRLIRLDEVRRLIRYAGR